MPGMSIRVVNRRVEPEAIGVYVGRPSVWGNPFVSGRDGTREEVIEKYRKWIEGRPHLVQKLEKLNPAALICWCAPLPCHADVLVELLEERRLLGEMEDE